MVYNKTLIKMKVNHRVNDTFVRIIDDLPKQEINPCKQALAVQNKNTLITYEQFYNYIYRIVLEYVPSDGENPLMKAIKMFPRAIKNARRIKLNNEIISFQNEILDKYFYILGNNNVKEKLLELEENINQLIEDGEMDILENVLSNFNERMRSGLLADLKKLSIMMDKQK